MRKMKHYIENPVTTRVKFKLSQFKYKFTLVQLKF